MYLPLHPDIGKIAPDASWKSGLRNPPSGIGRLMLVLAVISALVQVLDAASLDGRKPDLLVQTAVSHERR